MRVTTAFKRLLRLDGVNVTDVEFLSTIVRVTVTLRRRRLVCGHCGYKTAFRYDTRPVASTWRHLDLGVWHVELRAMLRRLRCPTHGVVVEGVPFARPGAKLTRDFDDLLAWLATRMDKTAIARLCRVSWRTVGRCAWDSFAIPRLIDHEPDVLVATRCPGCDSPHAWVIDRAGPPRDEQVAHFLVPVAHMSDDVVHACSHQRIFCNEACVNPWLAREALDRGDVMDLATPWLLAQSWYIGRLDPGYQRREPAQAAAYFREAGLKGSFWRPKGVRSRSG